MNLVRIAEACAVECERQKVGIRELGYLLEAYTYMQTLTTDGIIPGIYQFEVLGSFVEPGKNGRGFRRLPVTFQNGGSSAPASEIPRLMGQLVENINDVDWNSDDRDLLAPGFTREFLWIHPFADGNGRVGFLLYNYLMGTLDEPLPLPDFNW